MLTGENHVCLPCICMGDKYHAPNPTPSPARVNHAACLRAIPQLIPSIPSFNFLAHSLILFCMQLLSWSINHSLVVPMYTPLEVFSIRCWPGLERGLAWLLMALIWFGQEEVTVESAAAMEEERRRYLEFRAAGSSTGVGARGHGIRVRQAGHGPTPPRSQPHWGHCQGRRRPRLQPLPHRPARHPQAHRPQGKEEASLISMKCN